MSHYRHATATSEALAAAIEELQSALREAAGPVICSHSGHAELLPPLPPNPLIKER